jgi:Carboxypeptidase regulatory-like domain
MRVDSLGAQAARLPEREARKVVSHLRCSGRRAACAPSIMLIALILTVLPSVGQTTQGNTSLEVIVKDPSGALINKAQVQLLRNGKTQSLSSTNEKGEARFKKVPSGRYQIHVEAAGFKAQDIDDLDLSNGSHRREVTLEIDVIKVDVDVADEAQVRNTNPNGPAFTNVLTAEQIAQLPDDPEEFENAINQLAGPGAQIRVNGFRGGKLPPKSQIREILASVHRFVAEGFNF